MTVSSYNAIIDNVTVQGMDMDTPVFLWQESKLIDLLYAIVCHKKCCTAVSSEAWAMLRDWASVAARGRLLLSGSFAHASLKTVVWRSQWRECTLAPTSCKSATVTGGKGVKKPSKLRMSIVSYFSGYLLLCFSSTNEQASERARKPLFCQMLFRVNLRSHFRRRQFSVQLPLLPSNACLCPLASFDLQAQISC